MINPTQHKNKPNKKPKAKKQHNKTHKPTTQHQVTEVETGQKTVQETGVRRETVRTQNTQYMISTNIVLFQDFYLSSMQIPTRRTSAMLFATLDSFFQVHRKRIKLPQPRLQLANHHSCQSCRTHRGNDRQFLSIPAHLPNRFQRRLNPSWSTQQVQDESQQQRVVWKSKRGRPAPCWGVGALGYKQGDSRVSTHKPHGGIHRIQSCSASSYRSY